MQIADLVYLENIAEEELILGSEGVSVTSEAFAFGSESYPFASANTTAMSRSDGDVAAIGMGTAEAFGDDFIASVTVISDGETVIGKTRSRLFPNIAVASGFLTAINWPSQRNFYDLSQDLY